jgi:predicted amidohydrolase
MRVEGGDREGNLARASERVREAAKQGSHVVLLPECMDLGWTHPSALTSAEPLVGGSTFECLRALAQECGVYLCAGLVERAEDAVYNSAVLLDPQGELRMLHRKLNELDIGHPYYAQGDRLGVCQTEFGTFGLMLCADAFAKDHVITRTLGYMGADVILSPSSWAVRPDYDNALEPYGGLWDSSYSRVCKEFSLWIASVSNVGRLNAGPWEGWNCIGCSRVVSPEGKTLLVGEYGEAADRILTFDIETTPRPARGCSWFSHWK